MSELDPKILERIKRLLALSQSSNLHEAASAAQKAQELMTRHAIDSAALDVETNEAQAPVEHELLDGKEVRKKAIWRGTLAHNLAKTNSCATYWVGARLYIVGTPQARNTARYLYAYLTREIDRLAGQHAGRGAKYLHAFRVGAVHEIAQRLLEGQQSAIKALRAESKESSGATLLLSNGQTLQLPGSSSDGGASLARIDSALARMQADVVRVKASLPKLKPGPSTRVNSESGYLRGREAGATVNLARGPSLGRGRT